MEEEWKSEPFLGLQAHKRKFISIRFRGLKLMELNNQHDMEGNGGDFCQPKKIRKMTHREEEKRRRLTLIRLASRRFVLARAPG